jgi:flagellar biosynthesis anti-sigma factor FlgM
LGVVLFTTRKSRALLLWIQDPHKLRKRQILLKLSVDVSLSIADKVKSMSSEPPIDIQLVNEIRQKVAEGRYPIDVSAISSKMFESIKNG